MGVANFAGKDSFKKQAAPRLSSSLLHSSEKGLQWTSSPHGCKTAPDFHRISRTQSYRLLFPYI